MPLSKFPRISIVSNETIPRAMEKLTIYGRQCLCDSPMHFPCSAQHLWCYSARVLTNNSSYTMPTRSASEAPPRAPSRGWIPNAVEQVDKEVKRPFTGRRFLGVVSFRIPPKKFDLYKKSLGTHSASMCPVTKMTSFHKTGILYNWLCQRKSPSSAFQSLERSVYRTFPFCKISPIIARIFLLVNPRPQSSCNYFHDERQIPAQNRLVSVRSGRIVGQRVNLGRDRAIVLQGGLSRLEPRPLEGLDGEMLAKRVRPDPFGVDARTFASCLDPRPHRLARCVAHRVFFHRKDPRRRSEARKDRAAKLRGNVRASLLARLLSPKIYLSRPDLCFFE